MISWLISDEWKRQPSWWSKTRSRRRWQTTRNIRVLEGVDRKIHLHPGAASVCREHACLLRVRVTDHCCSPSIRASVCVRVCLGEEYTPHLLRGRAPALPMRSDGDAASGTRSKNSPIMWVSPGARSPSHTLTRPGSGWRGGCGVRKTPCSRFVSPVKGLLSPGSAQFRLPDAQLGTSVKLDADTQLPIVAFKLKHWQSWFILYNLHFCSWC